MWCSRDPPSRLPLGIWYHPFSERECPIVPVGHKATTSLSLSHSAVTLGEDCRRKTAVWFTGLVGAQNWFNHRFNHHRGSCRVNAFWGALHPSKSGLMNKHIVKHIVKHLLCGSIFGALCPVPVQVRISEQTYRETYRLSPD